MVKHRVDLRVKREALAIIRHVLPGYIVNIANFLLDNRGRIKIDFEIENGNGITPDHFDVHYHTAPIPIPFLKRSLQDSMDKYVTPLLLRLQKQDIAVPHLEAFYHHEELWLVCEIVASGTRDLQSQVREQSTMNQGNISFTIDEAMLTAFIAFYLKTLDPQKKAKLPLSSPQVTLNNGVASLTANLGKNPITLQLSLAASQQSLLKVDEDLLKQFGLKEGVLMNLLSNSQVRLVSLKILSHVLHVEVQVLP